MSKSKPHIESDRLFEKLGRYIPVLFVITSILVLIIIYLFWHQEVGMIQVNNQSQLLDAVGIEFISFALFAIMFTAIAFYYLRIVLKAKKVILSEHSSVQSSKDELLSLASHQLRTPATAVKQYLGMVIEGYIGIISQAQLDTLKKAYESNERQLETIDQILYVAKADAGNLELQKSFFNINQLIEEIIAELAMIIKGSHQKIIFKPDYVNIPILADRHCIRLMIENLISNACKYTKANGIIQVSTSRQNNKVIITVKDNGVGIKSSDFNKLFKKFSRIDNELSIQAGGSGIGLYLDKILCDLHEGSINVASQPHLGTTFSVELPMQTNVLKLSNTS